MSNPLNKHSIERYSRQIVLKDIGALGQKKILNAKVLIRWSWRAWMSCC